MNFLEKALLPSSSAALFSGPKILSPCFLNSSTIPSTNGASGPTIVRSILSLIAKSLNPSTLSSYTFCPSSAVVTVPLANYNLDIQQDGVFTGKPYCLITKNEYDRLKSLGDEGLTTSIVSNTDS